IVLVVGIRESASFNAAMVVLKLIVVLLVIGLGSAYIRPENWRPFLPYGWGGVLKGASYVFFAYIGFDSVSTHAEEARNPQRDVRAPRDCTRRAHPARVLRGRPSALPHAPQGDDSDRRPGGHRGGALPAAHPRRAGEHRHADGIRDRVRGRDGDAAHEPAAP